MKASKVLSSSVNGLKNVIVKVLRLGNSDVQTSKQVSPFGIDSNPIKNMVAIHSETGITGETIILGYINKECITNPGETRLYSTDLNGVLKSTVYLRDDETIEIMGDSNFAVKYNELAAQFNILKANVDACSSALSLPPSTADITLTKNDKIKTN